LLRIEKFVLGPFQTNTYLLIFDKKGIVIDPSWPYGIERVYKRIIYHQADIQKILLTHGHFDHFLGTKKLVQLLNKKIEILVHPNDLKLISQSKEMAERLFGLELENIDEKLFSRLETTFLKIDDLFIKIIHTPGHTPGSVCYYIPQEKIIFTGDTLFKDSVGRTDLPGGSFDSLLESLFKIVAEIHTNTIIYPGHGEKTTLERELLENSFLSLAIGKHGKKE